MNLTPLTGPPKHRPFLVLDIESKKDASQKAGFTRPFMVGVYDGDRFEPFFDQHPGQGYWAERYFWDGGCVDLAMRHILSRDYTGHHIYAHNAGRFDFLFLLPWLMRTGKRLGYNFSIIPVASSIQVLDVWRGPKRHNVWRFLDSFKLIPTSLDKAAKSFGLSGKLSHDLDLHERDRRWIEYNKVDCVQLYQVVERFHDYIENVLCGEVGITAPSTAVKLFRRKYLKQEIPRSPEVHDFIRSGYVGGRVEPFIREGSGLRYYDLNSSYPAAMLKPMPVGQAVEWYGVPPDRVTERAVGFVECQLTMPDVNIPPLPVKDNKSGKLIFPTGKLRGVWEWEELQTALEAGATIDKWQRSVWFDAGPLFEEYVRDLYRYRDKSQPGYDDGLAQIVKILLNATYGKFGMKTRRKKVYLWDDPELPDDAVPAQPDPECLVWYAEKEVDAPYIMPQIAARVTALARKRLYEAMRDAEDRGGRVYYCDTDSVITDAWMPSSTELGALKDELPEVSGQLHGRFIAAKLYMLTGPDFQKTKAKGLGRPSNVKDLEAWTREQAEKLARGERIWLERLEKVGTLARAGFQRGPRMVKVPRTLSETKGKRELLPDGTSRPWRLEMW